jgi:hypothetical protein
MLFGVLVDFDFFLLMILDIPPYTHHDFFTHTPFYWVIVWLFLFILSKLLYPHLNRKTKQFLTEDLLKILLNAFLIAGLSHLAADLLVGNVMLFYPLSNQPFTILRYIFEPSYFTGYFASVYFAVEIIIIAIFFMHLSRKFLKKHKWDDIIAYIFITVAVSYLGFTLFMNLQTYNNSFLEESNKPYIDYDTDFDTVRDIEDWDIDNDGIDNINDANYEKIVERVQEIINTNKLAVGENRNIVDSVLLHYGALSSYRLVSQAFYESHAPIEPILKNFYINTLDNEGYRVQFDHIEMLRRYFDYNGELLDLNVDSNPLLPQGKIFFILDEGDDVINMGITLSRNDVGIILPGENHIQNHSFDGILKFYEDIRPTFQIVQ